MRAHDCIHSVHFPGSRQYGSVGEIENASELEDAEQGDIVKVIGTKDVVAKATELLQVSSRAAAAYRAQLT